MVKNGYCSPVRFHSSEYEELRVLMANRAQQGIQQPLDAVAAVCQHGARDLEEL
ncbi:hypothetical protein [Paenibacillus periandrae]|uniref:hypothetical protein n=1 Tax=Paenibacillus periandrae TaxID=1761741 RepID=UPI001F095530|nr:hypothetical protein [Paenibacillus periandrae]